MKQATHSNVQDNVITRPLFLTACLDGPDGPYAGMVDDHYKTHAAYCIQHGFKFLGFTTADACGLESPDPYWFKLDLILRFLKEPEYSHVFWFDTDAIVVQDDVDLRDALPDHAWLGMTVHPYSDGEDVWHPQSGVMYVRSCPEAIAFFERVRGMSAECSTEQTAMHRLLTQERQWQRGFVVLPYPWNNTLHDQPHNPIVAAFHGNGAPARRREIMRRYVENGCLGLDCRSRLVDVDAARREHEQALLDGDVDRGIRILEQVTRDWPYEVNALKDLGSAYRLRRDGPGMVSAFARALALDPYDAQVHILIAQAYDGLRNDSLARYHYDRAIEIDPHCARAHLHRGYFLLMRGWDGSVPMSLGTSDKPTSGIRSDLPLSSQPPLPSRESRGEGEMEHGHLLDDRSSGRTWTVAEENWRLGIEGYEWCRCVGVPGMQRPYRTLAPMWDGGAIPGRKLIVWHEQGLGDSLWMVRWLPEVKRRSQATVILEAPLVLASLYEGMPGVDVVVPTQAVAGFAARWDEHVSIMSLFAALDVGPHDRQPARYIDGGEVEDDIRENDTITVGLCWHGSPTHSNDAHRSIPWEIFRGVMAAGGVRFVSLQHGDDTLPPMLEGDMAATARRIGACDLVITVDSAVAHLAGAMGKPTWLLIPTDSDWRWFQGSEVTPWYPSMRLFRQTEPGEWKAVIGRVATELKRRLVSP